jgi:hypothetical protein
MAELKLPYRDRGQDLLSAIDDARELDGEDREIACRLMTDAVLHEGKQTVGELLGDLERATREERRELVDRARSQAGLPSLASVEFEAEQRRREAAAGPQRDTEGKTHQGCHADGCSVLPISRTTGAPVAVRARRWYCPQHEHLAAPGDMDDWTSPLVMTAGTKGVVDVEELKADREREQRELERRRVSREATQAERREEAAALARYEKAAEEQRRRESPAGLP